MNVKSVNKVVVSTPDLFLKAKQVTKGNASNLLGDVSKARPPIGLPPLSNPTGPGAMRGPAERFAEGGAMLKDAKGFAPTDASTPGGSPQPTSGQGAIDMILNLLQRLLEALKRMLSGSAGQSGGTADGGGQGGGGCSGGEAPGGAGGGGPGLCNNGGGFPDLLGGPHGPQNNLNTSLPPSGQGTAGGNMLSNPTPDKRGGSWVKGLLKTTVKAGLGAATGGVPGAVAGGLGGAGGAGGSQGTQLNNTGSCTPPSSGPSGGSHCGGPPRTGPSCGSTSGGGSLEDRILAYLQKMMRAIEGELDNAMQQGDANGGGSGGAAGGDSRTAASQKVQQLVQKRAEMVEMVTNVLKSLFDTSQAVNRNIK